MNKIIQISLIVLVTVILLLALPASAMIGGQLDTEHTNVGAIMMLWKEIEGVDDFIGRLCTATLIRPRALVTAAHCYPYFEAQGADPEQIWISFDQDPFAVDATYLGVEAFIPHPDFETDGHDIALIILKDPVPEGIGGEPVDLPDENYLSNVTEDLKGKDKRDIELKVVGYGATGLWSLPDLHLDAIRRF